MPNCYTLTRKTDMKNGPVKLIEIDEELCKHFGVTPDPVKWFRNWENFLGFGLAFGKTLDQLIEIYKETDLEEVAVYLRDNFVSNAWAEIGRR